MHKRMHATAGERMVRQLAEPPAGWSRSGWANYLRLKAAKCNTLTPHAAELYRLAAKETLCAQHSLPA